MQRNPKLLPQSMATPYRLVLGLAVCCVYAQPVACWRIVCCPPPTPPNSQARNVENSQLSNPEARSPKPQTRNPKTPKPSNPEARSLTRAVEKVVIAHKRSCAALGLPKPSVLLYTCGNKDCHEEEGLGLSGAGLFGGGRAENVAEQKPKLEI